MNVYPAVIEPWKDERGADCFRATFPDFPGVERIGMERDDAVGGAIEELRWHLVDLCASGAPMPMMSPVERGQIGIASPIHWRI